MHETKHEPRIVAIMHTAVYPPNASPFCRRFQSPNIVDSVVRLYAFHAQKAGARRMFTCAANCDSGGLYHAEQ